MSNTLKEKTLKEWKGDALSLARAFGFLFEWEVLAMQVVLRGIEKESPKVVNFGAGSGTSGLAIREARPDAEIWTIDISESSPYGGLENERNAFKNCGRSMFELPHQILGDSYETGKNWKNGKIDFCFVDGDHSENQLRKDIHGWLPNMAKGGIMAFHDYDSIHWPDVKKVLDEFIKDYEVEVIMRIDTILFVKILTEDFNKS